MHNKAGLIPAKVRQWRPIGFLLTVLFGEGFPKKGIGQIKDLSEVDILAERTAQNEIDVCRRPAKIPPEDTRH
jgi:hypothetical protein